MRKLLTLLPVLFLATVSCKNETKNDTEVMAPAEDIMESDVNIAEMTCYRFVSAKDTILLKMEKMNDEIVGTLSYNYFEKDSNDGTFEGTMVGDTLYADYTFNSEGTVSVREVMFVKKGNTLVEGFAEVEEMDGKMKFKDNAAFTLNDAMALQEIDCGEN